jgi:hypothetical protein
LTRLALLAAALLCAAAAPVAETRIASLVLGDMRSAADRHWRAYCEMQLTSTATPASQPQ